MLTDVPPSVGIPQMTFLTSIRHTDQLSIVWAPFSFLVVFILSISKNDISSSDAFVDGGRN